MKKIFLLSIVLITSWFYSFANSYTNELVFLDENKTIKELKENIDILDTEKNELDQALLNLNTDYELKTFLRTDLTLVELNKIRIIVQEYNTNKLKIETELELKAKSLESVIDEQKLLLEEKRKLYSWLIPYINKEFTQDYLDYIRWDTEIFREQKNITTDIIVKKEILSTKVEKIENKIKEHREFINENIRNIINEQLEEKIQSLANNESFKVLSLDSKVKVLDKTIIKVKIKLQNLQKNLVDLTNWINILNWEDLSDKKIETYYITVEKLEEFKNSLLKNTQE